MDLNDKDLIQEEIKYAGIKPDVVFSDISADDEGNSPTEVESLCMSCRSMVSAQTYLLCTYDISYMT